ncbi:hypothetical protein D3C86_1639190 [compost metagenome]
MQEKTAHIVMPSITQHFAHREQMVIMHPDNLFIAEILRDILCDVLRIHFIGREILFLIFRKVGAIVKYRPQDFMDVSVISILVFVGGKRSAIYGKSINIMAASLWSFSAGLYFTVPSVPFSGIINGYFFQNVQ